MKLYKVHTLYSLLKSPSDYHLVEDNIVTQGKAFAKCEVLALLMIFFAYPYFKVSELAWNGLEPLKYQKNMARETSKFLLGERGRLVWVMINHVMEKVNCKN